MSHHSPFIPKKILDVCCGSKMFWFNKNHPETIYGDIREEEHTLCDGRELIINPDTILDFRDALKGSDPFYWSMSDGNHAS